VKSGFTMIQGEHTGGVGTAASEIRTIMFDATTKQFVNLGQHSLGRASDRRSRAHQRALEDPLARLSIARSVGAVR